MITELTNEERELMKALEHESDGTEEVLPDIDETTKKFIKDVIRYEVDHYEYDPAKQDPIVISDEEIDEYMDFYKDVYDEVMGIPYLDMNTSLNKAIKTREVLKRNDILLYARKEFARIELGLDEHQSDLTDLNTELGDFIDYSKIKTDTDENTVNIKKTDGAKLLINYLMKMRYGGKDMSQIDLILEKLTFDIERLRESTDSNKDKNIKDTQRAIDLISNIGSDTNTSWDDFLRTAIVTDKRALNLAKEMNRNPNNAKKYIDTIFGPQMASSFVTRLIRKDAADIGDYSDNTYVAESGALLLLYTMAKKVESCMKSMDCRSLIYRGYIIHYMLDFVDYDGVSINDRPDEYRKLYTLFTDIINKYFMYEPYNVLKKNNFHDEMM